MEFFKVPEQEKPMIKTDSSSFVLALTILISGLSGVPLTAQQSEDFQPKNVISANVIGLLTNTFNAEFERVISPTSTIGFGGSTASTEWYGDMDMGPPPEPPITGTDASGFPIQDWNDPAYLQAHERLGDDLQTPWKKPDTSTSMCSTGSIQAVGAPGRIRLLLDGRLV